ncbi:hypothetical protein OG851_00560 [Streptomyces sp. NBC_00161]|uniref:hypothetical protein n=1 Tax=Streptomyces sp. NBC_00161 TaxID=2975671 RepID=UPI003253078D
MTWSKKRVASAQVHAVYDFSEDTARERQEHTAPLQASGHMSEIEVSVLSTNFEEILHEQRRRPRRSSG